MGELVDIGKFKEQKVKQKQPVEAEFFLDDETLKSLELKLPDLNTKLPDLVLDAVDYKPSRCAGQIALRAGVIAMLKYDLTKKEEYYLTSILIEETESILQGLSKYVTSKPGKIRDVDTNEMKIVLFYSLKTPEDHPETDDNDVQLPDNLVLVHFGVDREQDVA